MNTAAPIIDPHTGEVFASAGERAELVENLTARLVALETLRADEADLRAHLAALLERGRPVTVRRREVRLRVTGAVSLEPGKKPPRSVNRARVEDHAETLAAVEAAAGTRLAPWTEVVPAREVTHYPGVAAFAGKRVAEALIAEGLSPSTFLEDGGDAPDALKVITPKPEVSPRA